MQLGIGRSAKMWKHEQLFELKKTVCTIDVSVTRYNLIK
uniref:Uncharacterized protein n=1 Tax=Arundo donax TaxID=35708 RepID=A0A0A9AP75_ARUDO